MPDYVVDGALPEGAEAELSRRDAPRDRFHRAMYSAFYLVDDVKSRTVGGDSLIPHLHWNLGVHPALGPMSDAELERLAALCPVGAIDVTRTPHHRREVHARALHDVPSRGERARRGASSRA